MKKIILSLGLVVTVLFFFSASCINDFSTAWNKEIQRNINALNACSLLPGGGLGCQNHAYENHDRNIQDIEDQYNCCEFAEC